LQREELESILMKHRNLNINYLEDNKEKIFKIIPELRDEDGFDQKNEWHKYNVWRHTEVALSNSKYDIEERVVLLLHDIGKPFSYQEDGDIRHFKGHAQKSEEMSKTILKRLNYGDDEIDRICWLIGNHSSRIDAEKINKDNIEIIMKLLDIQYCDAKAYNPNMVKNATDKLDCIRREVWKKCDELNKDDDLLEK